MMAEGKPVTVDELLRVLEEYADVLCEHSSAFDGCGKMDSDHCGGCKARAIVNRARKDGVTC
jgi:hypothetical protein